MQVFTSILALMALGGSVLVVACAIAAPRMAIARRSLEPVRAGGLWLAFVVSAGATAGSLYFSEVADYIPCQLCWYQRIAMYPLAVITLVAAIRNDRRVAWYTVPIAAIGAVIAAYHVLIEWRPSLDAGACSAAGPACTDVWFREFGFVTLAFMALAGFIAVMVFTVVAATDSPSPVGTESS